MGKKHNEDSRSQKTASGVFLHQQGKFMQAVKENGIDLVALSALLTTTMPSMKSTIGALQEAGLREQVKVMIGGAPITEAYAQLIGADGYAPDASRAATLAKSLMATLE